MEHIRVERDRIVFWVRISSSRWHRTTPGIARRALRQHPDLARHACVNAVGKTFGDVMEDTPIPHLLEHVTIDILTQQAADSHATHVGTSVWESEQEGLARIQVSMQDDLEVLDAFNQAVDFVNHLLSSDEDAGRA